MTASVLEKPEIQVQEEVSKEELCKKLCLNIFEGLLEGYEELKQKNPVQAETIESKINDLRNELNRQKTLI